MIAAVFRPFPPGIDPSDIVVILGTSTELINTIGSGR